MNTSGQLSLTPLSPTLAVERFLATMRRAAERSYPAFLAVLEDGLADCTLNYETKRAVFDVHPLEDYYFAAAVGLESARIRPLFTRAQANTLLATIAEKVDGAAGRSDRIVSDLVFTIVSQVDLTVLESQQQPHDQVVALVLRRMGIATAPETQELMSDLLFRHHLAEPLALEIPLWWPAFKEKVDMTILPEHISVAEPSYMPVAARIVPGSPPPRLPRRKAQSII